MYQQQHTALITASGGSISKSPRMISTGRASNIGKPVEEAFSALEDEKRMRLSELPLSALMWWIIRGGAIPTQPQHRLKGSGGEAAGREAQPELPKKLFSFAPR